MNLNDKTLPAIIMIGFKDRVMHLKFRQPIETEKDGEIDLF